MTTFAEIETEQMDLTAQSCFKKLAKLQREAKDHDNWTIVKSARDDITRFKPGLYILRKCLETQNEGDKIKTGL